MKNFVLLSVLLCVSLTACHTDDDKELYFIGDSLVARWDVSYWFPSMITHNDGRSGCGIKYIEEHAGAYAGKDVVVIVGTNDMGHLTADTEEAYVAQYVAAIKGLNAQRTFLFSIFPKSSDWCNDNNGGNERIKRINAKIKAACQNITGIVYVDVYDTLECDGYIYMQYSYDGLHLSSEDYESIRKILMKRL